MDGHVERTTIARVLSMHEHPREAKSVSFSEPAGEKVRDKPGFIRVNAELLRKCPEIAR